jgi:hypothetical protein
MATKKAAKKSAKKAATKKPTAKKAPAKKSAKKTAPKKATKYGPGAGKQVKREMDEMKAGTLKIGRSDKKVTNPKQAIAIALSEARKKGAKVPPNPNE